MESPFFQSSKMLEIVSCTVLVLPTFTGVDAIRPLYCKAAATKRIRCRPAQPGKPGQPPKRLFHNLRQQGVIEAVRVMLSCVGDVVSCSFWG